MNEKHNVADIVSQAVSTAVTRVDEEYRPLMADYIAKRHTRGFRARDTCYRVWDQGLAVVRSRVHAVTAVAVERALDKISKSHRIKLVAINLFWAAVAAGIYFNEVGLYL